jgi:hypothetical protein
MGQNRGIFVRKISAVFMLARRRFIGKSITQTNEFSSIRKLSSAEITAEETEQPA